MSQESATDRLVTVIIPAYKATATLAKAVESVTAQTGCDLEVLIVDDCSPDETAAVADRLAADDLRIRVIRLPENRGKSAAMNLASREARGKWIAILDSDDWYVQGRLERLVAAAEAAHVEMAADNQILFDIGANQAAGRAFDGSNVPEILDLNAFMMDWDPTRNFSYGMLKPVFRADFIRANDIEYDEQARLGEDYAILLNFFAAGGRAVIVPEALYCYVQPFGTISRQWAQPGRKPYNFEAMKDVNARLIRNVGSRLPGQLQNLLIRRGQGIEALIRYYKIRNALASRHLGLLCLLKATAPVPFWRMIGKKFAGRFLRSI